jgi:transcriptional regulator with XRE-family HTH domain
MMMTEADKDRRTAGDVGRRVAYRRRQLGLSYEDVGSRAGVAPGYVEYVERRHAKVSADALRRLAQALETRVDVLLGAHVETPTGSFSGMGTRQRLTKLDAAECIRLISPGGVGRVVYVGADGPEAFPVNFVVIGGAVLFRTTPGGVVAHLTGRRVGFEVDRIDEPLVSAWSVLLRGVITRVTDRALVARVREAVQPWAGGSRDTCVRIDPDQISGRRVGPGEEHQR